MFNLLDSIQPQLTVVSEIVVDGFTDIVDGFTDIVGGFTDIVDVFTYHIDVLISITFLLLLFQRWSNYIQ